MSYRIKLTFQALVFVILTVCLLHFFRLPSAAETEEERRVRIERMEELRHTEQVTGVTSGLIANVAKRLGWYADYGGTVRFTYTGGHDNDRSYGIQDSLAFTRDYELNVFLNMTDLSRKTKFYTRLRTTYTARKKNSVSTHGNDWTPSAVDAMYFERKYQAGPTRTLLTLGRQFASVGLGIAYAATADGVQVRTNFNQIELYTFYVRANPSDDDIDPGNLSPPSASRGHTHREFVGGQCTWNAHPMFSPYYFYVRNFDLNPRVVDPQSSATQGAFLIHVYQPKFVGMGASGAITSSLSYFAEWIHVTGTTTSVGDQSDSTPVRAHAYDGGVRYRLPGPWRPVLSGEWAFGSGDPDRQSTVNSTLFGNVAGEDRAFRPFGGVSLGYAFAPSLANIRATKFSGSASPFANSASERLQNIRLTSDFYIYRKHYDAGPVSDFDVPSDANSKKDLGKELNLNMTWRVWTDLSLDLRWGKYMPAGAYDTIDDANRRTRSGAPAEVYWRVQWSLDI